MTEAAMVCANHPERETGLRCNRCGKPICSACALRTPVGYRCRECVRGQQKIFDTALRRDYIVGAVVSAISMGIGIGLLDFLGIFGLFLAPVLGGGLAEVVRWFVQRRRSRRLPLVAVLGGIIGSLPHVVLPLAGAAAALTGEIPAPTLAGIALTLVWPLMYAGLALASLYYRLGGIRLG
ncbi:MAG: B-box zinc finger protein [Anaerolineales bacterium]